MVNRLIDPRPAFADSAGVPYSGGVLSFFASGTSTPQNVYSGSDLTGASTTITLNSAGRPSQDIFLSDSLYKMTLADSLGNPIFTADPVYSSDYSARGKLYSYPGSPNGNVAGTAGSGTILADEIWDRTNSILYVCTTSGVAAAAVWTAVNAASATPAVTQPQGYLTLTSATPVIASDVASATAVYYTPFTGNLVPIYNGATMIPTVFTELTLTLAAQHALNSIYDVFVFSNSGVPTLATGPAWGTITAGAGARGTGASTTELNRLLGYWTNKVQIAGRNGATTYTIGANLATYVGSIYIDGTAGQITCHRAFGQSRKWGVWNAYNRQPIELLMGDATASWNYTTNTIRQSRADATNVMTTFTGLPEEAVAISFRQKVIGGSTGGSTGTTVTWEIGIGVNVTNAYISGGKVGAGGPTSISAGNVAITLNADSIAYHALAPTIGINNINSLERCTANTGSGVSVNFQGGADDMMFNAVWRG